MAKDLTTPNLDDYELVEGTSGCEGCAFRSENPPGCLVQFNDDFDCCVPDEKVDDEGHYSVPDTIFVLKK